MPRSVAIVPQNMDQCLPVFHRIGSVSSIIYLSINCLSSYILAFLMMIFAVSVFDILYQKRLIPRFGNASEDLAYNDGVVERCNICKTCHQDAQRIDFLQVKVDEQQLASLQNLSLAMTGVALPKLK